MTCTEFQHDLPEIVEGGQTAEHDAHLKSCPMCAEMVADLKVITELAVTLRASDEPGPRVWNSIESALRKEGLIRQPQRESRAPVVAISRGWNRAWLLPVAAVVLVALGLVIYRRPPASRQIAEQAPPAAAVRSSPAAATAGDKNDQQVLDMVATHLPAMRAEYENNLRQVNAYIHDAEQSVQSDPNDEQAQQTLLDAYQQKAVVYEMAMDRSLP